MEDLFEKDDVYALYLDWRRRDVGPEMEWAYGRMVRDGTFKRVFYDGLTRDLDSFKKDLCRTGSLPFLIFYRKEPCGLVWLNNFEGKSARGHFVFFREVWGEGRSAYIGRKALRQLLNMRDEEGHLFDVIIGLVPKSNVLGWKTAVKSGFRLVGEIPNGVWRHYRQQTESAAVLAATRESAEEI